MMLSSLTHQTIIYVFHGSDAAMNGTESANVIPYLKNGMTEQPATLPSHFFCEKDERELRARDVSLDSLEKKKPFAFSERGTL